MGLQPEMELGEAGTWWVVGSWRGRQCGAQDGEVDVGTWKRRYGKRFLLEASVCFTNQSSWSGAWGLGGLET